MPPVKDITSEKIKLCIGSMKHRIALQKRKQKFLSGGMTYTFETEWTVWAGLATKSGLIKFSGINIDQVPTHIWKIRKIEALTSEYWVNHEGQNYKILSVEAVNDGNFQLLYCRLAGDDTKGGAKS